MYANVLDAYCIADLCCAEVDACAASPDCGIGGVCVDMPAPGTGYACDCGSGYTGIRQTDKPATCTEIPCDTNPPIDFINGASECAGTESNEQCSFKCLGGYLPSGPATCTRGTWSTELCNQKYRWQATPAAFDDCAVDCGACLHH